MDIPLSITFCTLATLATLLLINNHLLLSIHLSFPFAYATPSLVPSSYLVHSSLSPNQPEIKKTSSFQLSLYFNLQRKCCSRPLSFSRYVNTQFLTSPLPLLSIYLSISLHISFFCQCWWAIRRYEDSHLIPSSSFSSVKWCGESWG